MSTQNQYIHVIEHDLKLGGYHAMWPAGKDVSVGDFGSMHDGAFDRKGHLQEFYEVPLDPPDDKPDGLTWGGEAGVDVKLAGSGSPGPITKAAVDVSLAVKVTFHQEKQLVLRATGVRYVTCANEREMADNIIRAFRNKNVRMHDYCVTGLVTADSGAAAGSAASGATLDLTGKGDVSPGGVASLANLKANISIAGSSKTSFEIPMANGFVIAIRLVQLIDNGIIRVKPTVVDRLAFAEDYVATFDEVL